MVLRSAGEVGCAHCTAMTADRACQVCTRLVCEKCAADWATCHEPSGRVVRLGASARVRDIDPLGRFALVSHWRRPLRVFDLRQLAWADTVELPRRLYLWTRAFPPRLTGDGRLVYAELELGGGEARNLLFLGFRSMSLRDGQRSPLLRSGHTLDRGDEEFPSHGTMVSASGDRLMYVNDAQRVVVVTHATVREELSPSTALIALAHESPKQYLRSTVRSYEPLPRKVVQAAFVDGERDLLASASWSELALHRAVEGTLTRLGHSKTEHPGDVRWIAVAGPYLAAAVLDMTRGTYIQVHELGADHSLGPAVIRHPATPDFATAALSRDGRHLAAAYGSTLHLYALDTGEHTKFEDHSDSINAVRFAADDHVLISADTDNRVVLRPRTPAGYARVLIPIAVPG